MMKPSTLGLLLVLSACGEPTYTCPMSGGDGSVEVLVPCEQACMEDLLSPNVCKEVFDCPSAYNSTTHRCVTCTENNHCTEADCDDSSLTPMCSTDAGNMEVPYVVH